MKVSRITKSILIIILFLILGLLLIGIIQILSLRETTSTFLLLLLFIILNIGAAVFFQIQRSLNVFWSIKKLHFLPIGILIGGMIITSPVIIGVLIGKVELQNWSFNAPFTATSIGLTLAIVAWEELWFRGIFLNQCKKHLSAITISIIIGLLFMLVHFLNPTFDFLKNGPTLFFASAFLTLVYFYFKTIWLPIGIHFGNNYLITDSPLNKHWLLGNEGYFNTFILAGLFFLFVILINKKTAVES